MARGNVEVLRWLYEQWADGNMWALRDVADPDIEWEWSEGMASLFGGAHTYRGLEEIGAATREWLAAWDSYWMTAEEFIESGDEVFVLMRVHGRTAGSVSVFERRSAAVWAMRNGKAVRVRYYEDRDEALRAMGLRD